MSGDPKNQRFSRFAWGVLAYTVLVVLFGAVVRITGSGAGCGQHWPSCQGELAHLPKSVETMIELGHRVTSGLSFALVVVLAVMAFKRFARGHPVRTAAVVSVLFMTSEALVGAALVLLSLVGNNDSVARAFVMAVHLVNTSLLLGAMTIVAWASNRPPPESWRPRGSTLLLVFGLLGVLAISTTGAVTALGDTLYPLDASAGIGARLGGAHFLERARAVHPLVAVIVSVLLLAALSAAASKRPTSDVRRWSTAASALLIVQLAAGILNVLLSAPAWLQLVHLLFATLIWIALVIVIASHLAAERALFPESAAQLARAPNTLKSP
jgi:heme A synthase